MADRKFIGTYAAAAVAGYFTGVLLHSEKALVIRAVLRGGSVAYRLMIRNGGIHLPPSNNVIMHTTVIGAAGAGIHVGGDSCTAGESPQADEPDTEGTDLDTEDAYEYRWADEPDISAHMDGGSDFGARRRA